ncbi:hypothetical protein QW131_04170 [Roseibium salinum]|nr:hypothetical protein [Roseibium salinum]
MSKRSSSLCAPARSTRWAKSFAAAKPPKKERRRIGVELGGERGIAELKDIQKIFAAERWLIPFLQNIPERINEHRLKQDTDVLRLVDKCSARFPDHVAVIAAALVERADAPCRPLHICGPACWRP